MDREQVERIVAAAHRAPSADNCQPWTFRWDGAELSVHRDAERARNVLDHGDHLSYLTLGCVLEAIVIAARAEGARGVARRCLDPGGGGPWAVIRFEAGPDGEADLYPALLSRVTDRRLYRGGEVRAEVIEALGREAARWPSCGLHVVERPGTELIDFIGRADAYAWRQPEVYRDILRWIRFSPEELAAAGDGVAVSALGIELPTLPGLRHTRSPVAQRLGDRLGVHALSGAWTRAQIRSSSLLVAFTARAPGPATLVDAGQLALAAWLRLHQAGHAVQPYTLPSTMVYNSATCGMPEGTRPEFVRLFEEGRGVLRRAFGHAEGELPVWLFRAGPSTPLPEAMRAPRLPLSRVLTLKRGG